LSNDRSKTIQEFLDDHEVSSPLGRDILIIEDVPESGNSTTGGVTVENLFGNSDVNFTVSNTKILSANTLVIRKNNTPSTSSDTVTRGTIWFDSSYLYVAIGTNTIKRVALEAF